MRRGGRRGAVGATGPRAGMTLVEVLVALTILAGAAIALSSFVGRFSRTVGDADARGRAAELAAERLEVVKGAATYASIDSLFAEPAPVPIVGERNFRRQTLVRRVGGGPADLDDYRVVTVVITAARLREPVRRTTILSDF